MSLANFGSFGVHVSTDALKYGGAGCILLALAIFAGVEAARRNSPIITLWNRYIALLDRRVRDLFWTVKPASIAAGQALLFFVTLLAFPVFDWRWLVGALIIITLGPIWYLNRRKKERLLALEAQIEPFLLALTNALRTTSSIASALAAVENLMANPMRQELSLVLKELRVGSTIDQALLTMAARTHLSELDAALSSMLIGRQVGGNLTEILDTTAKTLREMSRLIAVLKSKTNSGRVQFLALAFAPVLIVVAFQVASPGYFNPLLRSMTGSILLVTAVGLWLVAIGLARKVLKAAL